MATAAGIADTFAAKPDNICPCCMGFLCPAVLNQICVKLLRTMQASLLPLPGEIFHSINLVLDFPVTFDVMRICVRTILTRVPEKTDPFPSFSELLHRLIGVLLKRLGNVSVVGEERSKNKVRQCAQYALSLSSCLRACRWCSQCGCSRRVICADSCVPGALISSRGAAGRTRASSAQRRRWTPSRTLQIFSVPAMRQCQEDF